MKIVFFTLAMAKGGAERVISNLSNEYCKRKDDVFLLTCWDDKQYELDEKINKVNLIKKETFFKYGKFLTLPIICLRYLKIILKIKPDVIISFLPQPCCISSLFKDITKAKLIGSERSNPFFQYKNPLYKLITKILFRRFDGFVFQTEGARNFFSKSIQHAKTAIIGNPIVYNDKKIFQYNYKGIIVSVGRFTVEKNYPLLIKAFKLVHDKYPNYKLKIVGKININLKLDQLINSLNLNDSVIFTGQTNDVYEELNNSEIFVLSSLSEGLPNSLMEAMAIGMPVVATDCPSGGPRQLISSGHNGLLVENNNVLKLADAIKLLIREKEYAYRLGHNAKNILKKYNSKKICDEWHQYINKVYMEQK